MQSYLILKEKAAEYNADPETQAILQKVTLTDPALDPLSGATFTPGNAHMLKSQTFDAEALVVRPLPYEKLDQRVFDLLLGVK